MYKPLAGLCTATAIFVCAANGYPSAPSGLPASTGTLTLTPSSGQPTLVSDGEVLTATGSGFAPDAAVTLALYSTPVVLAETTAGSAGAITAQITVPASLSGEHTVVAVGDGPGTGDTVSLEAAIEVTAPAATAPASAAPVVSSPASLAFTGIDVGAMILAGLGMVLAGFVLVRSAALRRRRRHRRRAGRWAEVDQGMTGA